MTNKFKKNYLTILLLVFLIVPCFIFYKRSSHKDVVLNVYNWGEFISSGSNGNVDVNSLFTKRTGIKINYTLFQTNEEMLAKVLGGGADYDVVCPSDYAISRLIKEGVLHEINFDNIPNYKFIDESLKNLDFDPENKHSVPYLWGFVGIFYNKKFVKGELHWDSLWDPKYSKKILMFDNPRDSFAISMIKNGKSINSQNKEEWIEAFNDLQKQRPLVQNYVSDQVYDKLIGEEVYLAPYYCGHSIPEILKVNDNIKVSVPEEGTNKFVDSMCILKTSKHKKEAEQYINFLCEYEISRLNAEAVGNISPRKDVIKELAKQSDCDALTSYDMSKAVAFTDLPPDISRMNDELWLKIKAGRENLLIYNLILILIFLFLIIWNIFVFLKSRKFKFLEWFK